MLHYIAIVIYLAPLSSLTEAVEDPGKPLYLAAGSPNIEIEPPCAKFLASDPIYATKPITLWCGVKRYKGDPEYMPIDEVRWSKYPYDNSSVAEADEVTVDYPSKSAILNGLNATLELGFASATAIGKYRCDLWYEGTFMATGNLFVNMRPVIEQEAKKMLRISNDDKFALTADYEMDVALEDSTVDFACNAIGYPEPTIMWERNGERIESDGRHFYIIGNTLTILRVSTDDAATFKCTATNSFFSSVYQENVTLSTTVSYTLKVDSQRTMVPLILLGLVAVIVIILIVVFERRKRKKNAQPTLRSRLYRPTTTTLKTQQHEAPAVAV